MTKTRQCLSYVKVWADHHLPVLGTSEEDEVDLLWAVQELEKAYRKAQTVLVDGHNHKTK